MKVTGRLPDVITFAGNGEPTSHPEFEEIIDDTIALRDKFCPKAKLSVLSNATFIHRKRVRDALMKVENNILKLDTADINYIKKVDRPANPHYDLRQIINDMKAFNGHLIIQTMFLKGTLDGEDVSNVSAKYVLPWLEALKEIRPMAVMIYTIDRDTPAENLQKATPEELESIRQQVINAGFSCLAAY